MIARTVIQAILAVSVMQVYPADMSVVEHNATFPEAQSRSVYAQGLSLGAEHNFPTASNTDKWPIKIDETSVGVVTSAVSTIVIDRSTGQVLYEKNSGVSRSIGSIVKLMTALVFLDTNPDLTASASLLVDDLRYGGRQYIKTNEGLTVGDLFNASLIGSDNSATSSLVRLSGLTEAGFIVKMNEMAEVLGMSNSTFVDETGLSTHNRSTVSDVALLIDEAMKNDLIRETTQKSQTFFVGDSGRGYNISSTNELLNSFLNKQPYQVVGGKTGFLPAAGYCFGSVISENNTHELIVVVLGSDSKESRFQDAKALASWVYKVFEWPDERQKISRL